MSQFDPFEGFQTTVTTSGTAVALNPQPYGNTNTILVYNSTACSEPPAVRQHEHHSRLQQHGE
jgi:hypothetical protein